MFVHFDCVFNSYSQHCIFTGVSVARKRLSVADITFQNGNCSDRSALEYCYLDVRERLFYEQDVCLQSELERFI
jgi:hypothetical protein